MMHLLRSMKNDVKLDLQSIFVKHSNKVLRSFVKFNSSDNDVFSRAVIRTYFDSCKVQSYHSDFKHDLSRMLRY